MPIVQEDWIGKPLEVIRTLFGRYDQNSLDKEIAKYFEEKIKQNGLKEVPSLNGSPTYKLQSNTLVRFRCMIQDVLDPELFLSSYETVCEKDQTREVHCGMYTDCSYHPDGHYIDFESPRNVTQDRQTFYCISVPAETQWGKQILYPQSTLVETESVPIPSSKSKRKISESEGSTDVPASPFSEASMETDIQPPKTPSPDKPEVTAIAPQAKKPKEGESNEMEEIKPQGAVAVLPTFSHLNFPIVDPNGVAALVKVYHDFDTFKVNQVVEFIGIVYAEPFVPAVDQRGGQDAGIEGVSIDPTVAFEETLMEMKAHSPPPSLVPRLHCIMANKIMQPNPLLPQDLVLPVKMDVYYQLSGSMSTARSELLDLLSSVLYGDRLAAEYTLLHLLSTVYARTEMLCLGSFALNISGFPPSKMEGSSCSSNLAQLIKELVPKCHVLPMTLENMNDLDFVPKKDYTANRLKSGRLQLSDGTHLVLDETAMSEGQLNENGVKNLTALNQLILWQKVNYDFQYHTSEFPCDMPVLVLSEGKSLLPTQCHLPLAPVAPEKMVTSANQPTTSPPSDVLVRLRTYLGLHRVLAYQLPDHIRETLEQDFVDMRKAAPGNMNADLFHLMLNIARLVSLSVGQSVLSLETWRHVKSLEKERSARLN